jgi:hypothetical protein
MENPKDQMVDPALPQAGDPNDPAVKKTMEQAKGYETILKNILHGKETREQVLGMLTDDPLTSLPEAAMNVNDIAMRTMESGGVKVSAEVQMVASSFLLDDLSMLGEASQKFTLEDGDMEAILEDTFQIYIKRGLDDGSIDPIQLQLETEKLMTEEQIAAGVTMGHGKVPKKPDMIAARAQQTQGAVRKGQEEMQGRQMSKAAQEKQRTALGPQAGGQQ